VSLTRVLRHRAPALAAGLTLLEALDAADDLIRAAEAADVPIVVHVSGWPTIDPSWAVYAHHEGGGCDFCGPIPHPAPSIGHADRTPQRGTAAPDTDGRSDSTPAQTGRKS